MSEKHPSVPTKAEESDDVRDILDPGVAVVTGAGRGIGRAIALALARRGLDLALLGRTVADMDTLAALLAVSRPGARTISIECDVASSKSVQEAAQRVLEQLGTPRVVVNNAGVVQRSLVEETSEHAWDHVIDVNLKGPYLVAHAFLPAMKRAGRGRFIQIGSISSTLGAAKLSAYCASKWGLLGFTKALAEELRGTGLQTMAVLPGSVDTAMLHDSGFEPQMTPEEVAGTVVYAALDATQAMNGAAFEVFGP
jgi:3-oxoacyl-[acyl-carrier protein] reductase